jgi:hypothetical protein
MEPTILTSKRQEWTFVALLCVGVMFSRISAIRFGHELNVDESLMLAQTSRYAADIVPWRSVDGTTSGPINTWALSVAHRLGMPLTYSGAHFFAAILLASTVALLYCASRQRFGVVAAAIGATTEATWIILSQTADFIHYSSELVPIFLVSVSLALGDRGKRGILSAFVLGIVPWAKLQAAPIAFSVGIWMLARVFWPTDSRPSTKRPIVYAAALAAAALSFSLILLFIVFRGGAAEEMWQSYFVVTKYYSGSPHFWTILHRLVSFYGSGTGCAWFAILLVMRVCLGRQPSSNGQEDSRFPWLLTFASAFVCVRTGLHYDHYKLLMLPALALLTAATFVEWQKVEPSVATRVRISAVALLVFAVPRLHEAYHRFRFHFEYPPPEAAQEIAAAINRGAPMARSLTVWGWNPSLYVETGIPPSTRHAVYHFLTRDTPARDFLRKTYMEDLRRSRSEVFIEGIQAPLGSFPELEAFVRSNYHFWKKFETASGPVSIYLINSVQTNARTLGMPLSRPQSRFVCRGSGDRRRLP